MIKIKNLTDKDIGRRVLYNTGFKKAEGRIKSWNDDFIFVVYKCNEEWAAEATNPEDLFFI